MLGHNVWIMTRVTTARRYTSTVMGKDMVTGIGSMTVLTWDRVAIHTVGDSPLYVLISAAVTVRAAQSPVGDMFGEHIGYMTFNALRSG